MVLITTTQRERERMCTQVKVCIRIIYTDVSCCIVTLYIKLRGFLKIEKYDWPTFSRSCIGTVVTFSRCVSGLCMLCLCAFVCYRIRLSLLKTNTHFVSLYICHNIVLSPSMWWCLNTQLWLVKCSTWEFISALTCCIYSVYEKFLYEGDPCGPPAWVITNIHIFKVFCSVDVSQCFEFWLRLIVCFWVLLCTSSKSTSYTYLC